MSEQNFLWELISSLWPHFISFLLLCDPLFSGFTPCQCSETALIKDTKNSLVVWFKRNFLVLYSWTTWQPRHCWVLSPSRHVCSAATTPQLPDLLLTFLDAFLSPLPWLLFWSPAFGELLPTAIGELRVRCKLSYHYGWGIRRLICLVLQPLQYISRHFWAYSAIYQGVNSQKLLNGVFCVTMYPHPHLRKSDND